MFECHCSVATQPCGNEKNVLSQIRVHRSELIILPNVKTVLNSHDCNHEVSRATWKLIN